MPHQPVEIEIEIGIGSGGEPPPLPTKVFTKSQLRQTTSAPTTTERAPAATKTALASTAMRNQYAAKRRHRPQASIEGR